MPKKPTLTADQYNAVGVFLTSLSLAHGEIVESLPEGSDHLTEEAARKLRSRVGDILIAHDWLRKVFDIEPTSYDAFLDPSQNRARRKA